MGACPWVSLGTGLLPRPLPNTTFISFTILSISSPVRLRGLVRWFALPLKWLTFFLTGWPTRRNRRCPMYTTFRHYFKNILSHLRNIMCMHCIPCLSGLKDYLEQASHWLWQTTMLTGQSVPVYTRPTHVHLACSIEEVSQLMASGRHRCHCQVASAIALLCICSSMTFHFRHKKIVPKLHLWRICDEKSFVMEWAS